MADPWSIWAQIGLQKWPILGQKWRLAVEGVTSWRGAGILGHFVPIFGVILGSENFTFKFGIFTGCRPFWSRFGAKIGPFWGQFVPCKALFEIFKGAYMPSFGGKNGPFLPLRGKFSWFSLVTGVIFEKGVFFRLFWRNFGLSRLAL